MNRFLKIHLYSNIIDHMDKAPTIWIAANLQSRVTSLSFLNGSYVISVITPCCASPAAGSVGLLLNSSRRGSSAVAVKSRDNIGEESAISTLPPLEFAPVGSLLFGGQRWYLF